MEEKLEVECPECFTLIDISDVDNYELLSCPNCGQDLERVGFELIPDTYEGE